MLTLFYAWYDGVVGMEIALIGYAICTFLFFAVCFLFRCNRTGKGCVIAGWMICELICDVLWYLIYYPDGNYVNHGIGGAAGMFLWPAALTAAAILVTAINQEKHSEKR